MAGQVRITFLDLQFKNTGLLIVIFFLLPIVTVSLCVLSGFSPGHAVRQPDEHSGRDGCGELVFSQWLKFLKRSYGKTKTGFT